METVLDIITEALRAGIGVNGAVFALAAIGLNVQFGYTGLLQFGHVAFLLLGSYAVALTMGFFAGASGLVAIAGLLLSALIAILLACVMALIMGGPTLKLRTDYLAIVTIAIAEILRLLTRSSLLEPLTNGVRGIQQFSSEFYSLSPFSVDVTFFGRSLFTPRATWIILVGWVLVLLSSLVVWRLMSSPWGRVLKSIREDEDAARALGKNVFAYKLQALALGGGIAALAGVIRALDQSNVNPDGFLPIFTFVTYAGLIIGGAGTILGPILGPVIYWSLLQGFDAVLREGLDAGWIPETLLSSSDLSAIRFVLTGLILVLVMVFRPQGVFGNREEMVLDAN